MFVDMHDPDSHVRYAPEFNSAVLFRVPRWHAVVRHVPRRGKHADGILLDRPAV